MKKIKKEIILASKSSSRIKLLDAAGISFTSIGANLDEESIRNKEQKKEKTSKETALLLAKEKSLKISSHKKGCYVIGGDQILSNNQIWYQKPQTMMEAKKQLINLRGKKASLATAVCVAKDGMIMWNYVTTSFSYFRQFSDEFLDNYLEQCGDSVLGVSAACCLEREGIQLLDRMEGDYHSYLGLPLLPLLVWLRAEGVLDD